jgi:hypothetical protein
LYKLRWSISKREDVQKLVEIVKSKKDKKEVLKECLILI